MDPSQFDEFTKSLATKTSRRQALKTFTATALGGILAFVGIRDASAAKKCPPGSTNCHGTCVNTSNDPSNCGICGLTCRSGLCCNSLCCADGYLCCNNTCTNLNFDPNNCGACGNVCSTGGCCNGACVDLNTDPNNCGACGNVCSQGETCKNGRCVGPSACPTGTCPTSFMCGGPQEVCGKASDCLCIRSVEGSICCGADFACGSTPPCKTSADCPSGFFCQAAGTGCCGAGLCVPPCRDPSVSLISGLRTNRG